MSFEDVVGWVVAFIIGTMVGPLLDLHPLSLAGQNMQDAASVMADE